MHFGVHFALLASVNFIFVMSKVDFNITPSVSPACTSLCSTLSNFAVMTTKMALNDSAYTLMLQPGNHSLTSLISLTDVTHFDMYSRSGGVMVTCNQSAAFKFVNVSRIQIANVIFSKCGNDLEAFFVFNHVSTAVISACTLQLFEGGLIRSYQSNVTVDQGIFRNSSSKNGLCFFERSHILLIKCTVVNNEAANYGLLLKFGSLRISQSFFKNNVVQHVALLYVQSASLSLCGNVSLVSSECYHGVIYAFQSVIESCGELNILENEGALYSVYVGRSKVMLSGKLSYSRNYGTLLIMESDVTFTGINRFSDSKSNIWAGALTVFQSKVHIIDGIASFYANSGGVGGAISMYESELNNTGELSIVNNSAKSGGGVYLSRSDLICQNHCFLSENVVEFKGGAIHAVASSVIVGRKIGEEVGLQNSSLIISNNRAIRGGGLSLKSYSNIYSIGESGLLYKIEFIRNSAHYGGAIYVDDHSNPDTCTSIFSQYNASSPCFLQTLFYTPLESLRFTDNHATMTGSILFGGLLDRCTVSKFSRVGVDSPFNTNAKLENSLDGVDFFQTVTNTTDLSAIDSYPVRVCHCVNGKPRCDLGQHRTVHVMKGEAFNVSVVAVNQVNKTINASLFSYTASTKGHLGNAQYLKNVSTSCTSLTFNVYSPLNLTDSVIVYAQGPCRGMGISPGIVKVVFKECACPIGFEQVKWSNFSCDCKCHQEVEKLTSECDIKTQSFIRKDTFWIKYIRYSDSLGYLAYPFCPFDYCRPPLPGVWINLNIPNGADVQCALHRTGLLCGACKPGYSLSAGSSRCIACHSWYRFSSVLLCIGIAIFGIVLVVLILALDLTVAVGTINEIVFYANVVATNSSIFLPFSKSNIFTVFIAFLNMSLGFDICIYKGMNSTSKCGCFSYFLSM